MFKKIKNYCKAHIDPEIKKPLFSCPEKPHVLLGLSGGPDSIFLLYFLNHLKTQNLINITAAHLNHGWREDACRDEKLCEETCEKLGVKLITGHAKEFSKPAQKNRSLEALGRSLRQQFYSKTKNDLKCDYVALAHHLDDQQETFFIRLIRGSSLSGLTGIKPVQQLKKYDLTIIRPLLSTPKEEIVEYLTKNKILYAKDPTNKSDNFLRNRIRNYIIPACKQVDPRFSQTFEQTRAALTQENEYLETICKETFEKIFFEEKNCFVGNKKEFLDLDQNIQARLIISWLAQAQAPFTPSTGFFKEVVRFLETEHGGSHQINEKWRIQKQKNRFWLESTKI